MNRTEIKTERLILRPIALGDRAQIQAAAGQRELADTMISIPHPFSAQAAERYVRMRIGQMRRGRGLALTLRTAPDAELQGLVELRAIDREHALGELSFWLAAAARGHGYMGEAIGALLQVAFEDLDLNRLYAYHMVRNPASGRLLARHGFRVEGLLRQRVRKWGVFEDVLLRALLRADWLAAEAGVPFARRSPSAWRLTGPDGPRGSDAKGPTAPRTYITSPR